MGQPNICHISSANTEPNTLMTTISPEAKTTYGPEPVADMTIVDGDTRAGAVTAGP
jgi:hypothetical protein